MPGNDKKNAPIIVFFTILLWGSAFPAIRVALRWFEPFQLASFRFFVASAALIAFAVAAKIPFPKLPDVPALLLSGAVGIGVYNLTLNTGQKTVPAGMASLLINTAPIWTAIMAQILLRDRLSWKAWLGIFISFIGVLIIVVKEGSGITLDRDALLVLIASLSHSIYIVTMKRHIRNYGPIAATSYTLVAGTLCLAFFSHGLGSAIRQAPLSAVLLVIYLGLFPAAIAYLLWGHVLSFFPPARAASFLYFVPLAAVVIAWIWIGETPTWRTLIGGVLVIVGVMLVNRKMEVAAT